MFLKPDQESDKRSLTVQTKSNRAVSPNQSHLELNRLDVLRADELVLRARGS